MDICITVFLNPATHPLETQEAESSRPVLGDIANAYPADVCGAVQGNQYVPHRTPVTYKRLAFVFITNAPDGDIKKVCAWLKRPYLNPVIADKPPIIKQHINGVQINSLPPPVLAKLQTDKYATIAWGQLQAFLVNKVTGNPITDQDLQR